jgi:predicted regulator of Ras-like GTPase activity (Roadblock/LC7/MglB family)
MVRKKRVEGVSAVAEPLAVEETVGAGDLRAVLEEVKGYDGVIGYILRNSTSAAIDLKDPSKIIDFAIISSSALDAGEDVAEVFSLGKVKDVVVEGGGVKVLSLVVGDNRISVFMDKGADSDRVLKKLLLG